MTPELIERRKQAARDRGQTFLVVYSMYDSHGPLAFMEEYRTEWALDSGNRYWWKEGYSLLETHDLYEGESKLDRVRRIRNSRGKWESWRT